MPGRSVLVTGMSGLIGRALRKEMEGRYDLRALNRSAVEGLPCHRADIGDLGAIEPAFAGVDTVVHLAAALGSASPPWERMLQNNVTGTYNVLEAARKTGVKRVVFASSGATISAIEQDKPYSDLVAGRYEGLTSWPILTHLSPVRPQGLYGVSKVWGGTAGRPSSKPTGRAASCFRIGPAPPTDRPLSAPDLSVCAAQPDFGLSVDQT